MQVSGVSDFFGSVFNCVLLLLSGLRLLNPLSNQLLDVFAHGVYTYAKGCHATVKNNAMKGCNALRMQYGN